MQIRSFVLWSLAALLLPPAAVAAVVASGAGGFVVREVVVFAGAPDAAWQRLVNPALWWSGAHTYSGSADNLSLALEPGGCWCERLPAGGFVRHMAVVYAVPGSTLRLTGGLGPLQGMGASGALTFTLKPDAPGTTRVVAQYAVTGFAADGFSDIAAQVDVVLAEQLRRFAPPPEAANPPRAR